ncbi:MAG: RagB/SusD family nutrient uptake outer membrane protein, partial [Bacteroidota bacterium]|nr:RagB/SusD family nutrient uptake outer membrane protein [Bacteroidota bacterium]
DIVLSRLGETYLIAAEAYLQAGQPGTGLTFLNDVRERAGVVDATLAEFDIDYILDERGRELMGEYHRWFDLKRTGTLIERASAYHYLVEEGNFNGANGELKILRPIPQSALDLNQNNDFEQNPAYQ